MKKWCFVLVLAVASLPAFSAQKLKEIATISGVRSNQLAGYGLVVGLDGTGDKSTSSPFASQSMVNMLNQMGVQIPTGVRVDPKNIAAVMVTAAMPAFAKPGQNIDVTVSSVGDAKNLRGGTLLMTPLKGADGQVYAMAQGNLVVAGAGAQAGGSRTQINQLNAGRIPSGATVEREVASALGGNGNTISLELNEANFTNASRVVQAINSAFGGNTARAVDGRLIEVAAPTVNNQRVQFLAKMENLAINPADLVPTVILNARTGSIVMNQTVTVEPCAVAHSNLSVTVTNTPAVSQPNALSGGQTAVTNQADIQISQDGSKMINVPRGANLSQIVKALNAVGATPQDLLAILQAMKAAGALKAELQII